MSDTGLTLTQQPPLSSATVALDAPVGEVWQRIAGTDDIQNALETGVNELVGHLHAGQRAFALEQHGVTALDGLYASAVAALADTDPIREQRCEQALRLTEEFGAAERSVVGLHASVEEIADGPLAVLRASEATPTLAIRVGDEFGGLRADQQREVIDLLADLTTAVDLRIVATGRWQHKLAQEYREQLPGVSEQCSAGPSVGTITQRVEAAREALDVDGRKVRILRQLAGETAETLSYNELYAMHDVTEGTVKQCLTASDPSLTDLGLVETFSQATGGGNAVELLAAGRELLDVLDKEIGRQQRIEALVSETGQTVHDSREDAPARTKDQPRPAEAEAVAEAERGGCGSGDTGVANDRGADRYRLPFNHQVRGLSRWHYAGTAAIAPDNGVGLADYSWEEADDRGEPGWFHDEDDNRVVVSAEYDSPFKWWVCIARALASPWMFRHVLPPERFDGELDDVDEHLSELFTEFRHILRGSRCIGYLKDAADGEEYVEALKSAEEHLCDLTTRWKNGDFDCSPEEYRSLVTREALGLASTMVHLLDLAGVDVVREARLPNYRKRDKSDRRTVARSIAKGAAIQSRYGEFAAFRQLFEGREDKRESAIHPTVDANDPLGEVIGSFVVSGPGVSDPEKGDDGDDLAALIADEIDSLERHEDAPEFAVHVPVDEHAGNRRTSIAQAVEKACAAKNLSLTRRAVSWCHGFTDSPYATATALFELGAETKAPGRNIRTEDVRFALSTLDADHILPDAKPTIRTMLKTLFAASPDAPLTNAQIENRGGPSARSIRRHADVLETFGVLVHDEAGWRLPNQLPIARLPPMARHALGEGGHTENLDTGIRFGIPGTELLEHLADHLETTPQAGDEPLANAVWRLLGPPDPDSDTPGPVVSGSASDRDPPTPTAPERATFGNPPPQASLGESASMGVAD